MKDAKKIIDDAAAKLSEHFDSVLILASWEEPDSTHRVQSGTGNFYARIGMATEFLQEDKARIDGEETTAPIVAALLERDTDDDEPWKEA